METDHIGEVEVGQDVAVEHQESLVGVEVALHVLDSPARIERPLLAHVGKLHSQVRAIPISRDEALGTVANRQYDIRNAVVLQQIENMVKERPVHQGQKRLGCMQCKRPQARALPADQDYCFHG